MPGTTTFGDSPALAGELLALIVDGPKRATAGAVDDYAADGEPLPVVNTCVVATDGGGRPRAVLRTTEVRIGPLSSVDDGFAWDEGEGDRTRIYWLNAHTQYFRRRFAALNLAFHDDIEVVFERFEVVYTEP